MVAGGENVMGKKGSEDDMTVRMGRATKGGRREKGFRGREDTATKAEAETGTPPLLQKCTWLGVALCFMLLHLTSRTWLTFNLRCPNCSLR